MAKAHKPSQAKKLEELLPPEVLKIFFNEFNWPYHSRGEKIFSGSSLEAGLRAFMENVENTMPRDYAKIKKWNGFSPNHLPSEIMDKDYIQDYRKESILGAIANKLHAHEHMIVSSASLKEDFHPKNLSLRLPEYLKQLEQELTRILMKLNDSYVVMENLSGRLAQQSVVSVQSQDQPTQEQDAQNTKPLSDTRPSSLEQDIQILETKLQDLAKKYSYVDFNTKITLKTSNNKYEGYEFMPNFNYNNNEFHLRPYARTAYPRKEPDEHSSTGFLLANIVREMQAIGLEPDLEGKNPGQYSALAKKLIEEAEKTNDYVFAAKAFEMYIRQELRESLLNPKNGWIKRVTVHSPYTGGPAPMFAFVPRRTNGFLRQELANSGLDLTPVLEQRVYHVNQPKKATNLQPEKILASCIDDYLAAISSFIGSENTSELKKLEFARRFFAKDKDLVLDNYMGALYKPTRNNIRTIFSILGLTPDQDGRFSQEKLSLEKLLQELKSKHGDSTGDIAFRSFTRSVKNAIIQDLSSLLTSKSTTRPIPDSLKRMMEVAEKFKPDEYTNIFEDHENKGKRYTIKIASDYKLVRKAAMATNGSCLRDYLASEFKHWMTDPGTIYLVGSVNGKIKGYTRLFLLRRHDKDSGKTIPVVGIDTIEPPRKDFHQYQGFVSAMGLAAIQLAMDMNASEIIGEDGRIKFGIRQAYSNTQREYELSKIGRVNGIRQYCFEVHTRSRDITAHLLMKNWKYKHNGQGHEGAEK